MNTRSADPMFAISTAGTVVTAKILTESGRVVVEGKGHTEDAAKRAACFAARRCVAYEDRELVAELARSLVKCHHHQGRKPKDCPHLGPVSECGGCYYCGARWVVVTARHENIFPGEGHWATHDEQILCDGIDGRPA